MTREEQIKATSAAYTRVNCPMAIGGDKFKNMIDSINTNPAFIAGAQWADDNQPNPWISVEERLPEVNQQVYAAIPNLCFTEYATLEYLGDNRWRQDTTEYTYVFSEEVTYWMPIPELPKE